MALLVSLTSFALLLAVRPFKRPADNVLAVAAQLLLIATFLTGILLDTFRSITEFGGLGAASRAMGFRSDEDIVSALIVITLSMILLLVGALLFESACNYKQQRLQEQWSCCTMRVPRCQWKVDRAYACFLSHYKIEAASDARFMHDVLMKVLQAPVFLDSSNLADLRTLFSEGVQQSDCTVLLATQNVLRRPWCLLELYESARYGIPILAIGVAGHTFDIEEQLT